jgi:hypothetical protein
MFIKDIFFFPIKSYELFSPFVCFVPILFKALNQKISKNIQPTRNLLVNVAPYCSLDLRIRNKGNEKEVPSNTTLISIDTNNTSHFHELSLVHGGGNGY